MSHPDLAWRTLVTEHFAVHFQVSERPEEDPRWLSGEGTALRVSEAAEALWLPMSDTIGHFPRETIHIVVVEQEDDLVGFTLPQWNVVVVSAHPGPQIHRMRGRSDWIPEVLAHELGHVWTHKAAGALAEVDSWGLEVGGLGELGGLAAGARLAVAPAEPSWWSEGGAEYASERVGVGRWSTEREMTLRAAVLDDRLLDWDELQTSADEADQADGERGYQQGYAFARWLDGRVGPGTFDAIGARASRGWRSRWDGLIRRVTGERAGILYEQHVAELRATYGDWLAKRRASGLAEGVELADWDVPWNDVSLAGRDAWAARRPRDREERRDETGSWNQNARLTGDGRWLVEHRTGWLRASPVDEGLLGAPPPTEGADLARARAERTMWLPAAFGRSFDAVPGRDALVVTASEHTVDRGRSVEGYDWNQLWVVDLSPELDEREHRGGTEVVGSLPYVPSGRDLRARYTPIPGTLRGSDPAVSPDGEQVAWLLYGDGTTNLMISRLDGSGRRALTTFDDGTWMSAPDWSPDGSRVVVSMQRNAQQNLWIFDATTGAGTALTQGPISEIDPWWADDGIWFAADPDGVYDIYRMDPDTRAAHQITRVTGGAATPSVTPSGDLLFASFGGFGWKTHHLRRDELLMAPTDVFGPPEVEEAAADLAFTVERSTAAISDYRPMRSLLPPAVSPVIRLDIGPDGPRALGGFWMEVRDARELHDLSLQLLLGDDQLGSAVYTFRGMRPDLQLYTEHSRDQRTWAAGRDRWSVDRVGSSLVFPRTDGASGTLDAMYLVGWANRELGLASGRLAAQLDLGDAAEVARIGGSGVAARFSLGVARSQLPPADLTYVYGQARSTLRAAAPLGRGPGSQILEVGWELVATTRDLDPLEEVRAGGDHPYAARFGTVEPSLPFPGYGPWSIHGEHAAVVTAGWRVPLARRLGRRLGPITWDSALARIAADVGDVWSADWVGHGAPLLADVVGELRLGALLGSARWDSFARLAWPLVPASAPAYAAPVLAEIDEAGGPRVYLGLGTGW